MYSIQQLGYLSQYNDEALGYMKEVRIPAGTEFYFLLTVSRPVLGPTQSPIEMVL
jgi:hypothetical protein